MIKKYSLDDLKQIEEAVRKAESTTSGEIVPVIYDKCSNTFFVFPLLFLLFFILFHLIQELYFSVNYWEGNVLLQLGLVPLLAGATSIVLSLFPIVQRLLIPKFVREQRVREKAELEFYRTGVPNTEGKTGVLIFVSLMERFSVVLADKAISEKLPPSTWSEVLKLLNENMSARNIAGGFGPAIRKCGELLSAHFPKRDGDVNELSNQVIVRCDQ